MIMFDEGIKQPHILQFQILQMVLEANNEGSRQAQRGNNQEHNVVKYVHRMVFANFALAYI